MKKTERLMMAAIAVMINMPMSASEAIEISRAHGVDHREVMAEVTAMFEAEQAFETDLEEDKR